MAVLAWFIQDQITLMLRLTSGTLKNTTLGLKTTRLFVTNFGAVAE